MVKLTIRVACCVSACLMWSAFATAQKRTPLQTRTWQNPVWDHDFPDPTVIRTPDGRFFAYGTQGGFAGKHAHIQTASSEDGIHWRWLGDALPQKPAWAGRSKNFWAPHVLYDRVNKRYVLYYAAQSDADSTGMCIGVATASQPQGPFHDSGTPLVCGKAFEAIDPMAFTDPGSGKHYLYWGSDFKPIMVRQLSDDWLGFAPRSRAKVALYPDKDHDYDKLVEGPWVIYHQGYYYLFYSGDNCCGIKAHYAVMVARSKSPEGPFIRYSKAHQTASSVILRSNDHWTAPGHNSVVADDAGNLWMYYHAIPRERFDQQHYGRVMLRDRIVFKNGRPTVPGGSPSYRVHKETTFTNPILPSGADPWTLCHDGYYYYMQTTGNRLVLWKTKDMAALRTADKKTIWLPPQNTSYSKQIWAPEIHYIRHKWYVYFAADNGLNKNHRIYVIENASADPMKGHWVFKGKVADPSDKWAIDASVFEYKKQWYMIWSGWQGDINVQQNIYIAKMKNPWTIAGKRVEISSPVYPWERHGALHDKINSTHVYVNEGPEILKHKKDLFLVYSASGCWTDFYELGMLRLVNKEDPLDRRSWKKYPKPVFKQSPGNGVYATGHNSFFRSPDGTQYWILYHANDHPGAGCGNDRSPRMQPFTWNADGTPDFGVPVKTGVPLDVPSGN